MRALSPYWLRLPDRRDGVAIGATSGTEVRKMKKKTEAQRVDIYTRITDRIVEDLSNGVRPWV